jgi:hypothetical protein
MNDILQECTVKFVFRSPYYNIPLAGNSKKYPRRPLYVKAVCSFLTYNVPRSSQQSEPGGITY